jgi:hypothetical protein
MVDQQAPPENTQFLLTDFNTRLRDIDERNRLIRERVLLLGKNLISSRQEVEDDLRQIKRENQELKSSIEKLTRIAKNLSEDTDKFVKREEIALVERMLKDFQPLEFLRRKDIEELIDKKNGQKGHASADTHHKKQIKTKKTKK